MQHDAADELHIEMAHLQHAPTGLARHRESLRQYFVEYFFQRRRSFSSAIFNRVDALVNTLAELVRLGPELLIARVA